MVALNNYIIISNIYLIMNMPAKDVDIYIQKDVGGSICAKINDLQMEQSNQCCRFCIKFFSSFIRPEPIFTT